ncbi:MAG: M4 family metallopeptidase, partial [Deltaproteobacteria bacterium]
MASHRVKIPGFILMTLIAWTLLMGQAMAASGNGSSNTTVSHQNEKKVLVDQLKQMTGSKIRMETHAKTGKVRYIGVDPSNAIRQPAVLSANPTSEEAARGFLSKYGSLFGLTDHARELRVMHTKKTDRGRSFVRFQQSHSGIPVLGGELIVQVSSSNNIVSAQGKILPDIGVDTSPTIPPVTAQEKALGLIFKYYGKKYHLDISSLHVSTPELSIYNPMLLGLREDRNRLVWRMEVYPTELLPIKELVLVDAHLGNVALHFNQIHPALSRLVYDHDNTTGKPLPGAPADLKRSEGQGESGITDVDMAYDYSGHTYDFYWDYHGRDSLDNAGMELISTTRYCPDGYDCSYEPYDNAFWNGAQVVYGEGWASALDVVGHEMTHGVTQHESNLFYFMQSGALNEAFSDIWGEFIEKTYEGGADTEWLIGENLPYGALRSMSDPELYENPDRIGSEYYICDVWYNQDIVVHYNSGVANKAAYLMAVGGAFNGFTVNGLGIAKAAKIFYEVQTHLLTSAGDYNDLYDALPQACANLVGTSGITLSDCLEVEKAVNATEMNQQPAYCMAREAPVCESGQVVNLFFDDLENPSSGQWTHAALVGSDQWYYPQNPNPYSGQGWDPTYATSGHYNFWGYDYEEVSDSYIAMTQDVAIPAGAYLHFRHAYSFEVGYVEWDIYYDGGVIEYTTDGGTNWYDAGSLITHNGYTGTLVTGYDNPLSGSEAFVGYSSGYISTRLDLSTLAGQNVRFRFRIGTDYSDWDYGWFIDDIRIYTCASGECSQNGLNEDFNGDMAYNWMDDESGRWSVSSYSYEMWGTGADNWAGSLYNAEYCDFSYQVNVRRTEGTTTDPMGLLFRADNPNPLAGNGYGFWITPDGQYSLWKYTAGTPTSLVSWTTSSAINTDPGSWNVLKVVVSGPSISIYVNGTLLDSVSDATYLSGKVGVAAYDDSASPDSVVEYDFATLEPASRTNGVDFNGDGKTDILWREKSTGGVYVWYMNGVTFVSGSWIMTSFDVNWEIVGTGDFNGDGKTDLLWREKSTGGVYVWYMNGVTFVSGSWIMTSFDVNWEIVGTGDFNGDGKTDLLWREKSTGGVYVWYMNGVTFVSGSW